MDFKDLIERLNQYSADYQCHGGITAEAADAIKNLLAEREAAGWISVEDKLPEGEECYLCAFDDGFIATASWIDGEWELWADSGEVTHWMPLPTPPDRQQKES